MLCCAFGASLYTSAKFLFYWFLGLLEGVRSKYQSRWYFCSTHHFMWRQHSCVGLYYCWQVNAWISDERDSLSMTISAELRPELCRYLILAAITEERSIVCYDIIVAFDTDNSNAFTVGSCRCKTALYLCRLSCLSPAVIQYAKQPVFGACMGVFICIITST